MGNKSSANPSFDDWYQENAFPNKRGKPRQKEPPTASVAKIAPNKIQHHTKISPRTPAQHRLFEAIASPHIDVIVARGQPRSGKTLCSVYGAIELLNSDRAPFDKILYLRHDTIDEDGAGIGYLKGGFGAKTRQYMHPFYDSLERFMDEGQIASFMASSKVEFDLPGNLRGRSLERYVVIADEIQNWTERKMRLLLTRLDGAKLIMPGDPDQVDSSYPEVFTELIELIRPDPAVEIIEFTQEDIQNETVGRMVGLLGDFGVGVPPQEPILRIAKSLEAIAASGQPANHHPLSKLGQGVRVNGID